MICPRRTWRRTAAGAPMLLRALLTCGALLVTSLARASKSDLPPEIGYNYGEIEAARTAALSGADRAMSSSLSALFVNPANVVVARVYHVGALAQIWPEARRQ